jgi:Domain of unknown function (DUF4340)
MKQKHLLLILIILLVVYIAFEMLDSGEKNYKVEFQTFDTSLVDKFILTPRLEINNELIFTKDKNTWSVESNGKTYQAEYDYISNLIADFNEIKTIRVAANKESQWKRHHVTDSLGIKVRLFASDKKVFDIIVGKFSPIANNNSLGTMQGIDGISMVRIEGKETVYSVASFMSISLSRSLNDFRNQTLLNLNPLEISEMSFKSDSENYSIIKKDSLWTISGEEISEKKMKEFLNESTKIYSPDFMDGFIPERDNPDCSVKFTLNNDENHYLINLYKTENQDEMILKSSVNNSYFKVKKDIWEKIFKEKSFFNTQK